MLFLNVRTVVAMALLAPLAAGPALAQPAPKGKSKPVSHVVPHRSAETPIDRGPFTPEANRAYEGGGVVLQGAPGAPPPRPEPTPPGQTPRNAVQP